MKKTKFFKPYTENKCTLTSTGPGVYIIKKNNDFVYIGYSATNVKKTMYRHFQEWNDPRQKRVVYKQLNNITCRVIFTTPGKAEKLEQALILKYLPKDNDLKIDMYTNQQKNAVIDEYINSDEVPF